MEKRICYCGNRKPYEACCYPFLSGGMKPETPEQLMRSRYSAFCTKNIEYLMSTRHPSMRQPGDREALAKTLQETQWLGLKVLKAEKGRTAKALGYVEFAAFYENDGIGQVHEKSKFIHENGQWYYINGQLLEPIKLGRNEPCWCGSGKKSKKCHGK